MDNNDSKSVNLVKYLISYGLAAIWILPILWMFFVSISSEGKAVNNGFDWFLPPYNIESYFEILNGTYMLRWIFNSFIVAFSVTIIVLILTSMVAFAISIIGFKYKEFVFMFFIIGMLVPIEANVIPLFNIAQSLGIMNSYIGLMLPMIALPLGVIILRNFFDSIPKSLIESAQIDGCGWIRMYAQIVLPLSKAAVAAVGIFTFITTWNNYLWALIVTTREPMYTIPVGIPTFLDVLRPDYVIPMTVNMVAALPAIIIFLVFQKQIIAGLKMSGIKG
ncbi:MAG: carbohydrate ABC transporter permease [Halanaerobium sp.]